EATDAPVDPHLADQLMLPMALFSGGRFRCTTVTEHSRTNAEVINRFLPGAVSIEEDAASSEGQPSRTRAALVTIRGQALAD
ncbi:MAG: RNA 3'-terminal phosphate cyclase, partial [Planctomycetota bacterium]